MPSILWDLDGAVVGWVAGAVVAVCSFSSAGDADTICGAVTADKITPMVTSPAQTTTVLRFMCLGSVRAIRDNMLKKRRKLFCFDFLFELILIHS